MNDPRSASSTGTAAFLPESPRFIAEISAGAREASLVALLVLALIVPAVLGLHSMRTLTSRGSIACYVSEVNCKPVMTNSPESP